MRSASHPMTPTFASPGPLYRSSALPHHGRCVMACVLSVCLLTAAGVADARTRGEDSGLPSGPVPIREGLRHEGLRNHLLTSSHEVGGKASEPRRLNVEERNALHRDLRDAMRGAYPEHPGPSRKKKSH